MSGMFAAVVLACVQFGPVQVCDVLQSPIHYASEQRCHGQGAILAGMYKGQFGSAARLSYRIACVAVEGEPALAESEAVALQAPR